MNSRLFRRVTGFIIIMAMVLSMFPSDGIMAAKTAKGGKTTIKTKTITVVKGGKKQIKIKNKKKKCTYVFKTASKKIAAVNKKGVVRGIKAGKTTIKVFEKQKKGKKIKTRKLGKVKVKVRNKINNKDADNKQAVTATPAATVSPAASDAAATGTPDGTVVKGDADIYVSPDGNDSGKGTKDSPFRTLSRAKDEVKKLPKNKDIIVEFADGFYPVEDTIKFTSADSGNDNCTITYRAAKGASPVISGGKMLDHDWTPADEVDWLGNGLKAYKIPLVRNKKLRAIYVNGERAEMTSRVITPSGSGDRLSFKKGDADWIWASSKRDIYDGTYFPAGSIPLDTKNQQNIELDSASRWARQVVCVEELVPGADGSVFAQLQMPYGAIAQNLGWNTEYSTKTDNTVTNVYEWLEKEGQFYFDQEGSTLYYIPKEGEDIKTAEVVIPELDTIVDMTGDKPLDSYVQDIVFDGLSFAYSDWNLYELEGSHGYASVQGAIVLKALASENQHDDIYRSYDVPAAAVHVTSGRNIKFLNGEIRHTGNLGIHIENDVKDIDVTGNYIGKTSGAGIVVGHPTHVYENDEAKHQVSPDNAGPDREKFRNGTEAVPENITLSNNYLLENCYFFSGHSPITTFYTYNLQVLHNFIYKCSYSGMSIGWGWCNFDGYEGSDSQLPGIPTTTSRNNHVNYNRVEEICSLLQDAGGIYTLGQQGNDDWTDYSEMSFNYINAKREPQKADGSRMVNGFHPDEGSAYIKFDSNVITNTIRNVYELNDWRRKHDMIVTNGFSNTDRSETTAPNCTLDQYVNADYIWPMKGYETVLNSGLEDEYVHMVGKDVIPDTDYELASNVRLTAGDKLKRRGLLTKTDTVWLAPEGTTVFAEGDDMAVAAGNVKEMDIPKAAGEYRLYIVYADGSVSDASTFMLYVGEDNSAANVKEGADYVISGKKPFTLKLDESAYSFKLNDTAVSDGAVINTEGRWTLTMTPLQGGTTVKILFTTSINTANKLISEDKTAAPGEYVRFDQAIYDSGKIVWLADTGVSAFDKNDPAQSYTIADGDGIKAPSVPGTYRLTVTNLKNEIDSFSDSFITVK